MDTRQELPANEVGEILCKGPQTTMGYLNNTEATKALYTSDGYLQTGKANTRNTFIFSYTIKSNFNSSNIFGTMQEADGDNLGISFQSSKNNGMLSVLIRLASMKRF